MRNRLEQAALVNVPLTSMRPCRTTGMPSGRAISSSRPRRGLKALSHRASDSCWARKAPDQAPSVTTTPCAAWTLCAGAGEMQLKQA